MFFEKSGETKGGKNYRVRGAGYYEKDRITGRKDYGAKLEAGLTW